MIKNFNKLFVTMFGLGKIPKVPGTFGSLATIIILYILFHTLNLSSNLILIGLIGREKAIACEVIISITKYD